MGSFLSTPSSGMPFFGGSSAGEPANPFSGFASGLSGMGFPSIGVPGMGMPSLLGSGGGFGSLFPGLGGASGGGLGSLLPSMGGGSSSSQDSETCTDFHLVSLVHLGIHCTNRQGLCARHHRTTGLGDARAAISRRAEVQTW